DVDPHEPVCHVSYYEAEAYATWSGYRLPTEQEWEHAAQDPSVPGAFLEDETFHPVALLSAPTAGRLGQQFGDVWEWTASPYMPYPGYVPFGGGLGEYNGKFMVNQMVLRGGCCVTPKDHVRPTYRNFYFPHQRWMFSGFRLAR
ncbi:MAG: ergothioneine biosynthesis protein EgtB, partial [Planctomycetota bacterium]